MIFKSCLFSCPQEVKNLTEMLLADYFYGDESEQFSYFRIPRLLITSPRFKGLSTDAKLLYGMLLDRMSLSAKNGWYDDQSRVYIYYTADEIRADMGCGNDKALKLLSELDTKKGVGLIERIKQGQGKPTKIYVKRISTTLRQLRLSIKCFSITSSSSVIAVRFMDLFVSMSIL